MANADFTTILQERLEVLLGMRGDSNARAVLVSDLQALANNYLETATNQQTTQSAVEVIEQALAGNSQSIEQVEQAIADVVADAATAQANTDQALQALVTAQGQLEAEDTALNGRITATETTVSSLLQDLANNYLTDAATQQAIAGAIVAYNSQLVAPTGAVGLIEADLVTNYLTATSTQGAISAAVNELSAKVTGGNVIDFDGKDSSIHWQNASSAFVRPPYADDQTDNSLLIAGNTTAHRFAGFVFTGAGQQNFIQGTRYTLETGERLRYIIDVEAPFDIDLFVDDLGADGNSPMTTIGNVSSSGVGWETVEVLVDVLQGTGFIFPAIRNNSANPVTVFKPSGYVLGTIAEQSASIDRIAVTSTDRSGALALLKTDIEAEYTGLINRGSNSYTRTLDNTVAFDSVTGAVQGLSPGPFQQNNAVVLLADDTLATASGVIQLPTAFIAAMSGKDLRVEVLAQGDGVVSGTIEIMAADGTITSLAVTPDADGEWFIQRITKTTGTITNALTITFNVSGDSNVAPIKWAKVIVAHATSEVELPILGTLSGQITDILALNIDPNSALAQFQTSVSTQFTTIGNNLSSQQGDLTAQQAFLTAQQNALTAQQAELDAQETTNSAQQTELAAQQAELAAQQAELDAQQAELDAQEATITAQQNTLTSLSSTVTQQGASLSTAETSIAALQTTVSAQGTTLADVSSKADANETTLASVTAAAAAAFDIATLTASVNPAGVFANSKFLDWPLSDADPAGTTILRGNGTLVRSPGMYGNALTMATRNTNPVGQSRPYVQLKDDVALTNLPPVDELYGVYVTGVIEFVSGSFASARLQSRVYTANGTRKATNIFFMADVGLSDTPNIRQPFRHFIKVDNDTLSDRYDLMIYPCENTSAPCTMILHTIDIEPVLQNSEIQRLIELDEAQQVALADVNQLQTDTATLNTEVSELDALTTQTTADVVQLSTAVASLEAGAAASFTQQVIANQQTAFFGLFAYDGPSGTFSLAKVNADNILLDGTVTAPKINVTNLAAITATIGDFKTSPTGERVEINDDGMRVYDSVGLVWAAGNLTGLV